MFRLSLRSALMPLMPLVSSSSLDAFLRFEFPYPQPLTMRVSTVRLEVLASPRRSLNYLNEATTTPSTFVTRTGSTTSVVSHRSSRRTSVLYLTRSSHSLCTMSLSKRPRSGIRQQRAVCCRSWSLGFPPSTCTPQNC